MEKKKKEKHIQMQVCLREVNKHMETNNCASLKMSVKWLVFSQKNDQNQTNEAENLTRPLTIK